MRADIIRIGNSKGVRLPAYILKECSIKDKVEMEVVDGKIVIKAVDSPRKNWSEKFKAMHENEDDKLIIDEGFDLNMEDWEW